MLHKYLLFISTILLLCSCESKQNINLPEPETKPENDQSITITRNQFESSGYELGSLQEKKFNHVIEASGTIDVPQKSHAVVSTYIAGNVGPFDWIKGQWVKQGTKLFTITNPELIKIQEEYLVLKSTIKYNQESLDRKSSLAQEKIIPKNELLELESTLSSAKTRLNSLAQLLVMYGLSPEKIDESNLTSAINIYAPISGYITSLDIMPGMYLEPSKEAMTLLNKNHKHAEINILERDAYLIKKNQKVKFHPSGSQKAEYEGSIYMLDSEIDEHGMIRAHCHISSKSTELIPGMYINAQIITEDYTTTALPEEAIVKEGDDYVILELISENNDVMTFRKVIIKKGLTQDSYSEVVNSETLNKGKQYLVKGSYYLIN